MKKRFLMITTLCLLLMVLAGCDNSVYDTVANHTGTHSFNARVVSIDGYGAFVEPVNYEDVMRVSDKTFFPTAELDNIGAAVGDIVFVTFEGFVRQTHPTQIDAISWSNKGRTYIPLQVRYVRKIYLGGVVR